MSRDTRRIFPAAVFACLAVILSAVPAFSQSASGRTLPNTQMLGVEDQSKQIKVTFWLNQRNKAGFDELVRQMYDRNSPNYHHWLTLNQYKAQFAPSASDMATIRQYLGEHNLHIVATDKLNHYVTVRGTVGDVQRAAGVQINRVAINGQEHRAAGAQPSIEGGAGKLIAAVQGLSDFNYKSHAVRPIDPATNKAFPMTALSAKPLAAAGPAVQYFNAFCLKGTQTEDFKSGSTYGIYSGSRYGTNIYSAPPNLPPCGYDAPQVDKAYGMSGLYTQKLDGRGQTVAIVDAYGSDTIASDANIFSQINGLPPLTSSNFAIYYPTGPTNCGGNTCGWDVETSLDVEWSHSVAPGANIALILSADNSFTNLDLSVLYGIENGLAPVISNSYGIEEILLQIYDPSELVVENTLNELGAALGISVNFSTGDNGDFSYQVGVPTVSMPASSPYATAVGGTSLFLNPDHTLKLQTGWGNNLTRIANASAAPPNPPIIPPLSVGFYAGAGGGVSGYWSKPAFQSSLPGSARLVPDIGFLADPYTGVEFIDTENGQVGIGVVGGTSLACPMFSALWAISTQAAGTWLGQAAPILYGLPSDAITDVLAVNGPDNVTGVTRIPPNPVVVESADSLAAPLQNTTEFVSALYQGTSTRWYVITFGTDTSLTTNPGWDNVTGLGTPSAVNFVKAVAAAQ
jgi:subtilase family serine protease